MTQKEFARREGINYHTFIAWLSRERQARRDAMRSAPETAAYQFSGPSSAFEATLEVTLAGEIVVRGNDPEAVARLVRALRANLPDQSQGE
jgi:hypothetical protein